MGPESVKFYELENGVRFGRSTAGIGDLDGDGVPDAAVGTSRDNDGERNAGAVYVTFLDKTGKIKAAQKISATYGFDTCGSGKPQLKEEYRFGYSVAPIGDVDGDGIVDLVVGSDGDLDGIESATSLLENDISTQDMPSSATSSLLEETSKMTSGAAEEEETGNHQRHLLQDGSRSRSGSGSGSSSGSSSGSGSGSGPGPPGAVYVLFMRKDGTVSNFTKISNTAGGLAAAAEVGSVVLALPAPASALILLLILFHINYKFI